MTYFTFVSPTCQQEAKRHGQTAEVNGLAQRIELGQAIDNLERLGRFRKKGLGKSYRLIIGEVYDQDDCLLVFWRVLPKSSKEYSSFCENPESFRNDFEVFCNTQNLEQVFEEKRQSSEIIQLRNLDEVERTYLYWPASHEVDEWLILESPEWVQRTDQETGPFSSYLSSLHDHVYNLAEKHPDDTETWDDKVGLLYRCLPEERLTYLIAPVKRGDTEDLERLRRQFQRELYAPIDAESLLRKSRRTYPELIVYEPELWIDRIQKESEKANLALSREEAEILRYQQDGYPLFINGRPGSGKSTVLQYLFADHLQQFMTDASMLGRPLYLTYSRDLLDIAKENVRGILTCNGRRLVSKGARNREEVGQSIEGCFADFRDFLFSLLPSEHRFVEDRYLSFPEFRLRFEERFSRHPNKHVRKITAELAWHVIRTYIKGMLSEQEEDFDVEHYKELPSKRKSLTDSTYEIVYQEIWLGWYRPLCEDEGYWDDQDLARRLLGLATDDPESFDLARYPVIFCDEAQDFTKNELRLIYRLSLFSRRNLTPDVLHRVPFAFAGDPFQTLNPTGFDWESTRTVFYEALVGQLDRAEKPTLELNYQELSFNYRSTRAIVQLCNFIHLVRGVAFGKRDLHPQRTYFDEAANMPVYFDVNSPVLQSKLRGQQEIVIIVPCQEGEELDYIQNDEFLRTIALSLDGTQIVRNILSPMRAKGQEFSRVVVYKFGEVCSTDYADLLELIGPQDQQRQMPPEQIIPAEYFINRLYVATSRAQKRLFIADTSKGLESFWRFFEKEDPAVFVQRYREHIQQPRNDGQFTWHVDDLVKIQPGDQNSWEQDHDNPSDLAEEFYRSGLRTKDTYKLRLAIQNYQAAGIADKQRECEGWLLEFKGEFEKAGECFAEIGNRDKARRLFWKAGAFHRILEFGENSLENAASAFMLSPNTEPNGDSLVFLSELSQAIKDGLIQLDETWGKVIGALLGYIIDRKPETDLQVHEWGNLSRMVEEFGRRGIYSRQDDRLLEQLRIRATSYPEKLGLLQKPGADPGVIADYYLARPRVPLTDSQADIVFQSLLRLHKYDELTSLVENYPSLKRLTTLLTVFIQQDKRRVLALAQMTFVFMCENNLWDAALEFATKASLLVDEEAKQAIRQYNWGKLLDELFIKALSISSALSKAEVSTKNAISKYLRPRLIEDPSALYSRVTVAQAGAALERANMILDCLEFYESVYEQKSWPAADDEQQLARERWLVCKNRQIDIQREAPKKQRIRRDIHEKQQRWGIPQLSELPEYPPTSLDDKPRIAIAAEGRRRLPSSGIPKSTNEQKIDGQSAADRRKESIGRTQPDSTQAAKTDLAPMSFKFDIDIEEHCFSCNVVRERSKMTIRFDKAAELVTLTAKNLKVQGSDDEFAQEIIRQEADATSARYFIRPWKLTCVLRQNDDKVVAYLSYGEQSTNEIISVRLA